MEKAAKKHCEDVVETYVHMVWLMTELELLLSTHTYTYQTWTILETLSQSQNTFVIDNTLGVKTYQKLPLSAKLLLNKPSNLALPL